MSSGVDSNLTESKLDDDVFKQLSIILRQSRGGVVGSSSRLIVLLFLLLGLGGIIEVLEGLAGRRLLCLLAAAKDISWVCYGSRFGIR